MTDSLRPSLTAVPTARECELAALAADALSEPLDSDDIDELARHLAAYREELLKPFVELQRDAVAYRDERGARLLDELIKTARGRS